MGQYTSFKNLATKLIDVWGQNVTLRNITDGVPADPAKPWLPSTGSNVDTTVKMAFFNETRVDQFGLVREPGTLIGEGYQYGIMADNGVEPTLKSVIILDGNEQRKVRYVNKINPAGDVVMYKIGVDK